MKMIIVKERQYSVMKVMITLSVPSEYLLRKFRSENLIYDNLIYEQRLNNVTKLVLENVISY